MERGPRMVIDARRGKKSEKREVQKPVEAERRPLEIRNLNREQRNALAAYLNKVDAIDAAFAKRSRTGREMRDAKKSGDPVWLNAAMQDGNRADDEWQEAKATAKAAQDALGTDFDDIEFGRKDVRNFLRVELAESQAGFDVQEENVAIVPEISTEDTQQIASPEIPETSAEFVETDPHAEEREAVEIARIEFVRDAQEAAQAVRVAFEAVQTASYEAYTRSQRIGEILGDIRVPGIPAVAEENEQCRNYIAFANAGLEDAVATMNNVMNEEATFERIAFAMPVIDQALDEARARMSAAEVHVKDLVPRVSRVDYLILDYSGDTNNELTGHARTTEESIDQAYSQFMYAKRQWEDLQERQRQIEHRAAEIPPEKTAEVLQEEKAHQEQEAFLQDMKETARVMSDGVAESRQRSREAIGVIARLSEDMRVKVRISGKTPMVTELHSWQTNLGKVEEGYRLVEQTLHELATSDASAQEHPELLLDRATRILSQIDSNMRTYAQEGNAVVAKMRQKVEQFKTLRFDGSAFLQQCLHARKLQEKSHTALDSRRGRWQKLLTHSRVLQEQAAAK